MGAKRLVLFVEGDADEAAVHVLVRKVLTGLGGWEDFFLDDYVFRVGGIHGVTGSKRHDWVRWLGAANKRPNLGAVLLVLDGDADSVEGQPFCAARVAATLAQRAREAGAGQCFSVACVFACREYESWLIAGVDSLRGKPLDDGRPGLRTDAPNCPADTDVHPRGAKEWFKMNMERGYKPTTDQKPLTELLDLEVVRSRARSFRRLESALRQLMAAVKSGKHIPSAERAG